MIKLSPEQAAQRLLEAQGIVTVAKFLKDSGYRKNPFGNKVRTYTVQQGNTYIRIMTQGKRSWGNRAQVDAVIRRSKRSPVIQYNDKFYLSLTLPIILKEKTVFIENKIADANELSILEPYKKIRKRKPSKCIDGKEREFRDFAIELGAVFHFNNEIIEVI